MNTDDLPEGPKPIQFERFHAVKPEDLVPFLERLKDQEFAFADLKYRKEEKAVDLLVERVYPPDKGTWALRIVGVESWQVEHQAHHERDTIRDIRIQGLLPNEPKRVVIKCVLDQFTAVVKAVDLRLVKIGAEKPAAVRYEDLPKWFREEVDQIQTEKVHEQERIGRARRDVAMLGLYWGGVPPFLIGLFTGGSLLGLLLSCGILGGGAAWLVAKYRLNHLVAGMAYGVPATAGCFMGGGGGFFFTPLILISLGSAFGIWFRGEEDMRV